MTRSARALARSRRWVVISIGANVVMALINLAFYAHNGRPLARCAARQTPATPALTPDATRPAPTATEPTPGR